MINDRSVEAAVRDQPAGGRQSIPEHTSTKSVTPVQWMTRRRSGSRVLPQLLAAVLVLAGCRGQTESVRTIVPDVDSSTRMTSVAQNPSTPKPPEGMVLVPGGVTDVGSLDGEDIEQPVVPTVIKPFYMDRHPVTVASFRAFVAATGYVTEAEHFGDAGVLRFGSGEWSLVQGASWHHPTGPAGDPAREDHPVTQVSWNDAQAYARWAGKRLPTEAEWEHAARGAVNSRSRYPWGDSLIVDGHYKANTWQGAFPTRPVSEDGFDLTSPVGTFGYTPLGLTDMAGNVWEWCEDVFAPYGSSGRDASNPIERVLRGGSFLCTENVCHGYRVSARSHATSESALFHVGFRLVADAGGSR